jgi:hypothetical protein
MQNRTALTGALAAIAILFNMPATPALAQTLTLVGLDAAKTKTLSPAEFAALPHVKLSLPMRGQPHTVEGVSVLELMRQVGGPWGDTLTGKDLADVVLATSKDGYHVVYSIGELDPGTAKGQVLIVDRIDGAALDAKTGPFEIAVENDLRPARWARMVERLQLLQVK